jgi:uncharacterized protein (DUF1330 family)
MIAAQLDDAQARFTVIGPGHPRRQHGQPVTRAWPVSSLMLAGQGDAPRRMLEMQWSMREVQMPGYVFMHADVTDPDGYEEFKSLAATAIADHGGRYLVRGGAMQPLEGQWRSRVILVEFPTYAAALAFYDSDAYQKARQVRLRSSTASVVVMDGISDT